MEDKPYSYILFVITLAIMLVLFLIWVIGILTQADISILIWIAMAHFVSLSLSPVGWYSGMRFQSQEEKAVRLNRIGLWGNVIFSLYLFGWIVFFVLLNLRLIGR